MESIEEKKARIKRMKRHKDIVNVCKSLNLSYGTYQRAMRREDEFYSDGELMIIRGLDEVIQERERLHEEMGIKC